jgi:hypothetical protein
MLRAGRSINAGWRFRASSALLYHACAPWGPGDVCVGAGLCARPRRPVGAQSLPSSEAKGCALDRLAIRAGPKGRALDRLAIRAGPKGRARLCPTHRAL